jgi:TRAP-type uncharacterized transport system substrate-binding protein
MVTRTSSVLGTLKSLGSRDPVGHMDYLSSTSKGAIKLPIRLRIAVVAGLVALAAGASFFAYRWYTRPVTWSIAVGSLDGEAPRVLSALASRLAATNAPVRLKIVETSGAVESASSFSTGKTDLAVIRGDVGDLSQAQAVVVLAQAVALLVAPPGSSITDMAGLKGVTVGVVGGEANQKIVRVLTKAYNLDRANVVFKNIALADIRRALNTKEVRALLFVLPLTEKYLSIVRGLFPQNMKAAPLLIPIENAGAIAEEERAYESFDIPIARLPSQSGRRCYDAEGFALPGCQEESR